MIHCILHLRTGEYNVHDEMHLAWEKVQVYFWGIHTKLQLMHVHLSTGNTYCTKCAFNLTVVLLWNDIIITVPSNLILITSQPLNTWISYHWVPPVCKFQQCSLRNVKDTADIRGFARRQWPSTNMHSPQWWQRRQVITISRLFTKETAELKLCNIHNIILINSKP